MERQQYTSNLPDEDRELIQENKQLRRSVRKLEQYGTRANILLIVLSLFLLKGWVENNNLQERLYHYEVRGLTHEEVLKEKAEQDRIEKENYELYGERESCSTSGRYNSCD